mgnify:CR=1 FL=1
MLNIKSIDRINIIELSKLSNQNLVCCTEIVTKPFFPVSTQPFFTGSKCETPISECCNYGSSAPNSCLNGGTCDDSTPGSPQCICDSCFTDEFCSTRECRYIFSQVYSLYFFFSFLLIYGCLRVEILGFGFWFGFFGLGFLVDGVWGLWCRASFVFLGLCFCI